LKPNATDVSKSVIFTQAIHLADPGLPVNYGIKKTGYYCVGTAAFSPLNAQYSAMVEFRNAYGELPAAQIAKLPFYGGITIVYAVIGAYVKPADFHDPLLIVLDSGRSCMSNIAMTYVSLPASRFCQETYVHSSTGTKLHYCNNPFLDS
jgi:hypothetical protein